VRIGNDELISAGNKYLLESSRRCGCWVFPLGPPRTRQM